MKKIIVTLLAVMVLVASFATVTAFAADSPSATPSFKVSVTTFSSGKAETGTYTSLEDGSIKLEKNAQSTEKFAGWVITVVNANGETVKAVEGVDYVVVSGTASSDSFVIKPLKNINVEESYDVAGSAGESKPADTEEVSGEKNESTQSPATGNNALASMAVITMLALAGAVAVKKVRV